ncbi:WG repeat-containing protein [Zobellia galactanivorans]|uniref:WG repeat-containing protein n=1 Tax=Zobellia galactanivorans (strain DSM 12802 / CCUG 47099 / CIP 106680 / NCIMB 13871 / Dsij) TaxID=63186 RepID=UPI001C06DFA8|nr:WG repeat-containing protein [Zobellia galactanivorans]MBU3026360.1 WG repeat-containing protein [Zobellia galactanivorans]
MKKIFQLIALFLITSCNSQSKEIIPFETDKGWGYKQDGEIIIQPKFGIASEFTDCGIAAVGDSVNGNYFIDKTGKKLNIPVLKMGNFIDDFHEGFARFKKNEKLGFINQCGKIVIEAKFESVTPFKNKIAIVRRGFEVIENGPYKTQKGGKYGAIDKTGNLIIPYEFDFISEFSDNNTANAKVGNKDVIINSKGKIIK